MYIHFLIEDESTEVLVGHVMRRISGIYPDKDISWKTKYFKGIGNLPAKGTASDRKTGKLLNDLSMYLKGFDKILRHMEQASLFIVLDNDERDTENFRKQLNCIARDNMILTDHVFCIAVKEMEAWLLGDINAIEEAYPNVKKAPIKKYEQDGLCDTWQVLADMVYPGGLKKLEKVTGKSYNEIGKMKKEWADKIGRNIRFERNSSPSFQYFIRQLMMRMEAEQWPVGD